MQRKMKPETIERCPRERIAHRGRRETAKRLQSAYEGDVIAVSQDYADSIWGELLQNYGEIK